MIFKKYAYFFSAGASGGVYSLIFAHLATLLLNWKEDSSVRIKKVKIENKLILIYYKFFDLKELA